MSLTLQLVAPRPPYYAQLRLPPSCRDLAIRDVDVHERTSAMQSHYWTHFRIEDQGDQYRIHVTTEPLPCPPKRRNTPGNRWNEERDFIRGDFAAYLGNLRYHRTQILLNSLNETIDREWLGRRPLSGIEHAYGDGLFTWVPPEHRTDWLTRAYRDLPKGDLVLRDPVRMVNALLCSAPVRDAEARVDFFD